MAELALSPEQLEEDLRKGFQEQQEQQQASDASDADAQERKGARWTCVCVCCVEEGRDSDVVCC